MKNSETHFNFNIPQVCDVSNIQYLSYSTDNTGPDSCRRVTSWRRRLLNFWFKKRTSLSKFFSCKIIMYRFYVFSLFFWSPISSYPDMGKKPALASRSLNFSTMSSALASSYFLSPAFGFVWLRTWFLKNDKASSGLVGFFMVFIIFSKPISIWTSTFIPLCKLHFDFTA